MEDHLYAFSDVGVPEKTSNKDIESVLEKRMSLHYGFTGLQSVKYKAGGPGIELIF